MQQTEQNTNLSALVPLIQEKLGVNIQDTLTENEQAEISKLALGATDLDQVIGGIKPETKEKLGKVGKIARVGGETALAIATIVLGVLYGKSRRDNTRLLSDLKQAKHEKTKATLSLEEAIRALEATKPNQLNVRN